MKYKLNDYACNGRLTLTTGVPVTTADVDSTTLYFTPYLGDQLALYTSSVWTQYNFTELSIAVPATTNTHYDVFVYDNAGTLTLELAATAARTTQNGVEVKTGATNKRYLGAIRTTAVSGHCASSKLSQLVWNNYNQVMRYLEAPLAVTGHTYNSTTTRAYNNDATLRFDLVCGKSVLVQVGGYSGTVPADTIVSIMLDATNSWIPAIWYHQREGAVIGRGTTGAGSLLVAEGYHYFQTVEATYVNPSGNIQYAQPNGWIMG